MATAKSVAQRNAAAVNRPSDSATAPLRQRGSVLMRNYTRLRPQGAPLRREPGSVLRDLSMTAPCAATTMETKPLEGGVPQHMGRRRRGRDPGVDGRFVMFARDELWARTLAWRQTTAETVIGSRSRGDPYLAGRCR
jgi:hypothetical protein